MIYSYTLTFPRVVQKSTVFIVLHSSLRAYKITYNIEYMELPVAVILNKQ